MTRTRSPDEIEIVEIPVEEIAGTAKRWGGIPPRWFLMDPLPAPLPQWRRDNPNPICSFCGRDDDGTIRPAGRGDDDRLACRTCNDAGAHRRKGRVRAAVHS